ncbi:MAG: DUF2058 domain-containing protein [Desulfobulbaceae bacterium]|jgi:uncharacterized protein YaiL (DUF2058 family)|nr:DUF2058 domain-containing protein [Desulfobulbaceae bacterium]
MGNPFQDQLLKAGLVNKKQVNKAKHDNRVDKKENKHKPVATGPSKLQLKQAAEKKRIKELNQLHRAEKLEKEKLAQVKQLIEQNRLKQDQRGDPYNFVDANKIKRIYVSDDIGDQISCGQAAIVKYGQGYEIVPLKIAQQIGQRDKSVILVLHAGKPEY